MLPTLTLYEVLAVQNRVTKAASPRLWATFSGNNKSSRNIRCINTLAPPEIGKNTARMKKGHTTVRPSTLDPSRLSKNDIVDLSGKYGCYVAPRDTKWYQERLHIFYKTSEKIEVPFTPGTTGVFYFNDRKHIHSVAGDIRFRSLPDGAAQSASDMVELFQQGHDLMDYRGFSPWRTSLLSIIFEPFRLTAVQGDKRYGALKRAPYSGIVLVRFEMIEHKGKKRVVLRVLKFLKPPDPNDSVVQEEGSFLKKFHRERKVETVWMAGTQTRFITPSSFKLLEETYLPNSTA
ncbi:hypothetical protein NMY22_g15542 [Coprinellus aureogranulatus]|nr:hypothetical protein NMY22_g15542 [Coprinellus aureogranulatus]